MICEKALSAFVCVCTRAHRFMLYIYDGLILIDIPGRLFRVFVDCVVRKKSMQCIDFGARYCVTLRADIVMTDKRRSATIRWWSLTGPMSATLFYVHLLKPAEKLQGKNNQTWLVQNGDGLNLQKQDCMKWKDKNEISRVIRCRPERKC